DTMDSLIGVEDFVDAAETVLDANATIADKVVAVGGAFAKRTPLGKVVSKARNKPPSPLKEAEGRPHSIIEKPGKDGQYTTHNGDGTSKQFRGSGQEHGGVPRPNVKEIGKNVTPDGREFIDKGRVRPARPDEIPEG
ncbi:hypothetical protein, partial [Vibrio sp. M260112]|uniref:hypothetical protein n=1 Tax=Vibrio sp. M260112 TaxID=3020895 RepID=UPI002F42B6C4